MKIFLINKISFYFIHFLICKIAKKVFFVDFLSIFYIFSLIFIKIFIFYLKRQNTRQTQEKSI